MLIFFFQSFPNFFHFRFFVFVDEFPVSHFFFLKHFAAGTVSINGSPTEGETLTAITESIEDEDGIGDLHFRWKRDGGSIVDAADQDTYILVQADVGSTITVEVSYEDGYGHDEMLESQATASVANTNDVAQGNTEIFVV